MKTALLIFLLPLACLAQHPLVTGAGIDWRSGLPTTGNTPLAGYFVWYDITNGVIGHFNHQPPTNGETVKVWLDSGPNAFNLTNTGGLTVEPVFYTNPTIAFSQGNQTNPPSNSPWMFFATTNNCYLTNKFGGTSFSQPNTYFMVVNGSSRNGNPIINPTANQNQQIAWPSGSAQPTLFAGSGQNGPLSDTSTGDSAHDWDWRVYTFQFNGSSSILRSNSVALALSGTTVGAGALQGITMGNFFNLGGGSGSGTFIVEFVGYNSALVSSDMVIEERYLAKKYGLKNVP